MSSKNVCYTGYSNRHIRRLRRKQTLSDINSLSTSNLPPAESSDSEDHVVHVKKKECKIFDRHVENIWDNDYGKQFNYNRCNLFVIGVCKKPKNSSRMGLTCFGYPKCRIPQFIRVLENT